VPPDEPDHLPLVPPSEFSPDIERDLRPLLAKRIGHEPSDEELRGYRQLLWAFTIALQAIKREERRKKEERRKAKKSSGVEDRHHDGELRVGSKTSDAGLADALPTIQR
jgi:hypothetical protein